MTAAADVRHAFIRYAFLRYGVIRHAFVRHAFVRHGAVRSALVRTAPALTVAASLALTFLLIRERRFTVLALAAAVLASVAFRRPATTALLLIPLGALGSAVGDATIVVLAVVVVSLAVAVRIAAGAHHVRPAHLWVALMACLLVVSFVPCIDGPVPVLLVFLDLAGILVGLGLLAAAIAVPPRPRDLARVTALVGALAAGYALAVGDEMVGRLQGLDLNPNYLGALLAPPLVAAVGLTRRTRNPAWLAAGAVCVVAMACTQSRAAFIAATVGIAVTLVHGRPRRHQALIALATAVTVMLPGILELARRLTAGDRGPADLSRSRAVRQQAAEFALQTAIEHPLHGIGYGMFSSYAARSPGFGLDIGTHNDYLRLAAESGAATLCVFLVILWLAVRERPSGDLTLPLGISLAFATNLLFANLLSNLTISMPFWLSLGCLLAAARHRPGTTRDPAGTTSLAAGAVPPAPGPEPT
ncbi:O-antigen ligase family protein [Actinomadura sp. HBU206391]|uniref:O-antigen ligase family protein n=1 Tax=Actinomadura sp. HBU206391 TaxID=2731692 RepID=UPI0016502563|nr:O-antigen ligase family protein [Actinomadura sp. HBU206391]MBC6456842.1 O-antigen ligase family protein [Actinomadura sp. HBU206391]